MLGTPHNLRASPTSHQRVQNLPTRPSPRLLARQVFCPPRNPSHYGARAPGLRASSLAALATCFRFGIVEPEMVVAGGVCVWGRGGGGTLTYKCTPTYSLRTTRNGASKLLRYSYKGSLSSWLQFSRIFSSCFERRSQRNLRFGHWPDFSFVLKYNSKLSARVSAVQ
jgi:hypothetical protein